MANITDRHVIYLDTFSAVFNSNALPGIAGGVRMHSIEWSTPTTVGHTCKIFSDTASGPLICDWNCSLARKGEIKYFSGKLFNNIHIAISGVGSGVVIIMLR